MSESTLPVESARAEEDSKYRLRAAAFLGLVGGASAIFGFSKTLGKAKQSQGKLVEKSGRDAAVLIEEGSVLAMRALGWGTLYAVLGTSVFCYGFWKLSDGGVPHKDGKWFAQNYQGYSPTSRTEFDSLTDFMKYLGSGCRE